MNLDLTIKQLRDDFSEAAVFDRLKANGFHVEKTIEELKVSFLVYFLFKFDFSIMSMP